MTYLATIQQLTTRIRRIETEVTAIRRELQQLPAADSEAEAVAPDVWANKSTAQKQMQRLFTSLAIQGEPLGAELLQKQMAQSSLTANELSQSIIAAREE